MTDVKSNNFVVQFDQTLETISWQYDGHRDKHVCGVGKKQGIQFSFLCTDGTQPASVTGTLHAHPLPGNPAPSPFVQGPLVQLNNPTTLTVIDQAGDWGFGIDFTATWPGHEPIHGQVPDPELQVGSIPPRADQVA